MDYSARYRSAIHDFSCALINYKTVFLEAWGKAAEQTGVDADALTFRIYMFYEFALKQLELAALWIKMY